MSKKVKESIINQNQYKSMNVLNKPMNVRLNRLSQKVVQFAGISLLSFALPASATEISKKATVATKEKTNFFISKVEKLKESTSSLFVQKKITGTVFDQNGETLPGANIVVKGTTISTQTNIDGTFTIEVPDNATILIVSFVGLDDQEVAIKNTPLRITLKQGGQKLEEVVVVGYGKQKKVNLSGAVNTVNTKTLANRPVTSLTNALQGSVPGVNILGRPGDVGNDMGSINIRGRGNLGASEALYVVDGVPVSSGDFSRINPNDVESISVLKDASASAIYGSRAAYGVILVTTKKGKEGKMAINYNTYYASQSAIVLPKWLGAYDYATLRNEAASNAGKSLLYSASDLQKIKDKSDLDFFPDTDWYGEVLRASAPMSEHQLSISGGGDTRYFLSGSAFKQNSLLPGKDLKRYSFRSNIESKVTEKFKIGTNISFIRDGFDNNKGDISFVSLNRMVPLMVLKQSNGNWGSINGGKIDGTLAKDNPMRSLEEGGRSEYNTNRFLGSLNATFTPITGLDITGQFSYNYYNSFNSSFENEMTPILNFNTGAPITGTGTSPNKLTESWSNSGSLLAQLVVSYEKNVGKHFGKVLVGTSFEDNKSRSIGVIRKSFVTNGLNSINAGSTDPLNTTIDPKKSGIAENAFQSVFGRFNYGYDDKYLFESSLRVDESSRFAPGHRRGVFPSFSGAWRVSQEEFMESVDWVSELKFRASWGKLGSVSNVGNYDFYDGLTTGVGAILDQGKQDGVFLGKLANPNLSWEKVDMTNIGLDLGLWRNKLNLQLDVFERMTNGILLTNPSLPDEAGLDGSLRPSVNLAKVQNKGIELSLTHNNHIGDFNFSVGGNLSRIWNKVVDLGGQGDQINGNWINRVGQPIGSFYMLEADGLFASDQEVAAHAFQANNTKAGDIKYKDQNGDNKIDGNDRVVMGADVPYITYGINITANYKNFDFSLLGQGVADVKVYLNDEASQAFFNGAGVKEYMLDRWTVDNPNPNASYPRLLSSADNTHNARQSSFWLFDASYFRVKSLSFGYNCPESLTSKINVQGIRVYVSSNNPFTLRGDKRMKDFDPETASVRGTYPQLKTFSLGLNISL
ncbi:SusC/RagA family TonB-linked outer membrane protein [Flavobacterium acetivorans]|uniref:SusC/RagA family TonB-linked outer membrane protein n=1 Tax=Flavobacterium acetivorans TaxID=2893883 RepID=UPI001E4B9D24|nr:TonB-dependent receptor [Flavobacterium sp. F-29]UFH36912.1 TonB-dependent receptor [Flavobacterium sp. F-29]